MTNDIRFRCVMMLELKVTRYNNNKQSMSSVSGCRMNETCLSEMYTMCFEMKQHNAKRTRSLKSIPKMLFHLECDPVSVLAVYEEKKSSSNGSFTFKYQQK